MTNRVTGEIDFGDGLRIVPHCTVDSLSTAREKRVKRTQSSHSEIGNAMFSVLIRQSMEILRWKRFRQMTTVST